MTSRSDLIPGAELADVNGIRNRVEHLASGPVPPAPGSPPAFSGKPFNLRRKHAIGNEIEDFPNDGCLVWNGLQLFRSGMR
jgi:hypothetical protein